jgi:hypothetical protein
MMISCLLIGFLGIPAEEAMDLFAFKRSENSVGVTIPTQRQCVKTFAQVIAKCTSGEDTPLIRIKATRAACISVEGSRRFVLTKVGVSPESLREEIVALKVIPRNGTRQKFPVQFLVPCREGFGFAHDVEVDTDFILEVKLRSGNRMEAWLLVDNPVYADLHMFSIENDSSSIKADAKLLKTGVKLSVNLETKDR